MRGTVPAPGLGVTAIVAGGKEARTRVDSGKLDLAAAKSGGLGQIETFSFNERSRKKKVVSS